MALSHADAIQAASSPMDAETTSDVLDLLLSGSLEVDQGALLLSRWAERGETGIELGAAVRFLRERAIRVPTRVSCFDLCGTGGSGLGRYNVSTTVAFVAAAAGIPVAKHGNRGSRRPNGSFDLLEALEVPFALSPADEAELLHSTGLCFLFARRHHPTVGQAAPYRKAAGRRTIFNLAGPLANPAELKHQLIGTTDETTAHVLSAALSELGTEGAFVVWGEPGIDEMSVTGKTGVLWVTPDGVTHSTLDTPKYAELDYGALPQGDANENKETFLELLEGRLGGPLLEMVCVNAGAALDLWAGRPPAYDGLGAQKAHELIASGEALDCFQRHRETAQRLTGSGSTSG